MLSSGTVVWPTLLAILSIWGVEVPVAYLLMQRWGLDGVWYGYPAAFLCALGAAVDVLPARVASQDVHAFGLKKTDNANKDCFRARKITVLR